MGLTLPPDLEQFVNEQVAHGGFATPASVIEAGLQLLRERREELKALIDAGIEQADRGELTPFDPLATLSEVLSEHGASIGESP